MPRQPPAQMTPAAKRLVVAGLQQGRKGQQAHQRHHGADDARPRWRRSRRSISAATAMAPGTLRAAMFRVIKQPLHDVGALHDVAHEQEQGHRHQHIVGHDGIGLVDQQIEDTVLEDVARAGRAWRRRSSRSPIPMATSVKQMGKPSRIETTKEPIINMATCGSVIAGPPFPHPPDSAACWACSLPLPGGRFSIRIAVSISSTSCSRFGHSPVFMQMTQRMVSAIPCSIRKNAATGRMVFKGEIGTPTGLLMLISPTGPVGPRA